MSDSPKPTLHLLRDTSPENLDALFQSLTGRAPTPEEQARVKEVQAQGSQPNPEPPPEK